MKNKCVSWLRIAAPFVVLAVLMLIVEKYRVIKGDDVLFRAVLDNQSNPWAAAVAFVSGRYSAWSSRLVIEFVLIFLVRVPWLWKILDVLVMVWIAVAMSLFFNRENKPSTNWMIVLLVLSFPIISMGSAGWIATTMNYSWPLAAGLVALMPFRYLLQEKKVPVLWYPAAILFCFFAISQEQMCAIMMALCVIFSVYLFMRDKKISWFGVTQSVLSLAGLIFIFIAPGNAVRKASEIITWFPNFSELSFLRKVELGYSRALFEFIMKPNLVFSLFCGLLLLAVCMGNRKPGYRWVSAIPFFASLMMGLFSGVLGESMPNLMAWRSVLGTTGSGVVLSDLRTWLPVLFVTAVGVCVLIGLYAVFEKTPQMLLAVILLLGGLASAWIMGFSPTVWASSDRTFIFMYASFIAVGAMLYRRIAQQPVPTHLKPAVATYLAVHLAFTANQYLLLI